MSNLPFLDWLRLRRGELLSAIGVIGTPVVNILAGAITVRFLSPEQTGTLNLAALWPVYLGFLHFGTLTGMARQLPFAIGSGDSPQATRILAATSRVVCSASAVGAAVCLVVGGYLGLWRRDWILGIAVAAGGVTILSSNIVVQVDTALRSYGRFTRYGVNQLSGNAINLLTLPLIPFFGVWGAIGRIVMAGISALLLRSGTGYLSLRGEVDWKEIRKLTVVGMPLLISGMFFNFLIVSDRSVVAFMLSRNEIGLFTLAGLIVNSMQFVPQSISLIMFPKMAVAYGASKDPRSLRPYILKTVLLNITALLPLSLAGYILMPVIITRHFPAYTSGINAGKIACMTCLFWVYLGMGSVFGVLNKMKAYLAVLVGSVCLVWLFGILFIRLGYGIEGAAVARLLGTAIICGFTIYYSLRLTSSTDRL